MEYYYLFNLKHHQNLMVPKVISYDYMKQAFDSTFFASALDLIKKNLDCDDYWYGSIEAVFTQFVDIEIRKTFE